MRQLGGIRRDQLLRLVVATVLVTLLLLVIGCATDVPQNTFDVKGDVADQQRNVFNLALWPAIAILILVEGLLVFALFRFRRRKEGEIPKQVHGNTKLELAWTILPAALILVLGGLMVPVLLEVSRAPAPDSLRVNVTGFQYFWRFEYPDFVNAEGEPLVIGDEPSEFPQSRGSMANFPEQERRLTEMHIPVDREIGVWLEANDVLHSFWVPKLFGKLDAVPGRTSRMWFNATEPGVYSGQCAEFCGIGHADMRFVVVVHESEDDFMRWVESELSRQAAAQPRSSHNSLVFQGE